MFHYLLLIVALVAVFGVPSVEALAAGGPVTDYLIAIGVAFMLKPWLQSHLE